MLAEQTDSRACRHASLWAWRVLGTWSSLLSLWVWFAPAHSFGYVVIGVMLCYTQEQQVTVPDPRYAQNPE